MKHNDSEYDQMESMGASMIRLNLREWEVAPRFDHLKDAPVADFETCDTIWPIDMKSPQLGASTNPRDRVWTVSAIAALLEQYRQRATYSAVSSVVGLSPRKLMTTQPKTPRYSWIVAKKNGLPTGYSPRQIHNDLKKRAKIIASSEELQDWLENPL